MKKFELQRRLASKILEVGRNKVWFDPIMLKDIQQALTRADIDELIKDNAIRSNQKSPKKTKHKIKKKGIARTRKKINVRKRSYMIRIRKIRKHLKNMRDSKKVSQVEYYNLRKKAKSGQFADLRHLIEHINSLKEDKKEFAGSIIKKEVS